MSVESRIVASQPVSDQSCCWPITLAPPSFRILGAPSLIEYKQQKFLIINNPTSATLPNFINVSGRQEWGNTCTCVCTCNSNGDAVHCNSDVIVIANCIFTSNSTYPFACN